MTKPRYQRQQGWRLSVQVPTSEANDLLQGLLSKLKLTYGDFDQVAYFSSEGLQQFRSLPGGRNRPTEHSVTVPCLELSFFLAKEEFQLDEALSLLYDLHPYEEPVIFVTETIRTLHIRGLDEDNPNKFWNRPTANWVPPVHRG